MITPIIIHLHLYPSNNNLTTMADNKQLIFCVVLFSALLGMAFGIASVVVAVTDGDNLCQGDDSTHLSLKSWLLTIGIDNIVVTTLGATSMLMFFICEVEVMMIVYMFITILNLLFELAWFIIGIVILARSNGSCISDATPIGTMTLIMIILQGLGLFFSKSKVSVNSSE